MSEKSIREKYGGKLAKAINRAIRAELPGGNQALEKLTQLAAATLQVGWKDLKGKQTQEAAAYYRHKRDVIDTMDAEIRKKWKIEPPAREQPSRVQFKQRAPVKPARKKSGR